MKFFNSYEEAKQEQAERHAQYNTKRYYIFSVCEVKGVYKFIVLTLRKAIKYIKDNKNRESLRAKEIKRGGLFVEDNKTAKKIKELKNEPTSYLYEDFEENSPIKPYFDIDLYEEFDHPIFNRLVILEELKKAIIKAGNICNMNICQNDIYISSSHGIAYDKNKTKLNKISYHVVISNKYRFKHIRTSETDELENPLYMTAYRFMEIVRDNISEETEEGKKLKGSGLDSNVYGKKQKMRVIYSYKHESDKRQFIPIDGYSEKTEDQERQEEDDEEPTDDGETEHIKKYLIIDVIERFEIVKYVKYHLKDNNTKKKTITETKEGKKEYDEKKAIIFKEYLKHFKNNNVYISNIKEGEKAIYAEVSYCGNDKAHICTNGQHHERRTGYLRYDKITKAIYAGCHSSKCKHKEKLISHVSDMVELYEEDKETSYINSQFTTNDAEAMKIITEFFETDDIKALAVKGRYGTGKTEILNIFLNNYKKGNKLPNTFINSYRQSLTQDITQRLNNSQKRANFQNYLKMTPASLTEAPYIIISPESIKKLFNVSENSYIKYDIIIIDECEALLRQYLADTVKNIDDRISNFKKFVQICETAKKLIFLDADLSNMTYEYIKHLNISYKIIVNNYKPLINKNVIVFNSTKEKTTINRKTKTPTIKRVNIPYNQVYNEYIKHIKNNLLNKKKVVVCSCSSTFCHDLKDDISKDEKLKNINLRVLIHTRNADDVDNDQLDDITTNWANVDILIYSPKVSAGLDFSTLYYDSLYMYVSNSCTPSQLLQMSHRVRNFEDNNIYLLVAKHLSTNTDNIIFNYDDAKKKLSFIREGFDTLKDIEIIKEDEEKIYIKMVNYIPTHTITPTYQKIYNRMLIYDELDKMNNNKLTYLSLLFKLMKNKGYNITYYEYEKIEKGQKIEAKTYNERLNEVEQISPEEFKNIMDKEKHTEGDKMKMDKHSTLTNILNINKTKLKDDKTSEIYTEYLKNKVILKRLLTFYDMPYIADHEEYKKVINKEYDTIDQERAYKQKKIFFNICEGLKIDVKKIDNIYMASEFDELLKNTRISVDDCRTYGIYSHSNNKYYSVQSILNYYGFKLTKKNKSVRLPADHPSGKKFELKPIGYEIKANIKIYEILNIMIKKEITSDNDIFNIKDMITYKYLTEKTEEPENTQDAEEYSGDMFEDDEEEEETQEHTENHTNI